MAEFERALASRLRGYLARREGAKEATVREIPERDVVCGGSWTLNGNLGLGPRE